MRFVFKNLLDETMVAVDAVTAFYYPDDKELTLAVACPDKPGYDATIFVMTKEEANKAIISATKDGYAFLDCNFGIQDFERYSNYSEWHSANVDAELQQVPEVTEKLKELGYSVEEDCVEVKALNQFND